MELNQYLDHAELKAASSASVCVTTHHRCRPINVFFHHDDDDYDYDDDDDDGDDDDDDD